MPTTTQAKTYTIGQVAAMFYLSTYTLRYYDKKGLIPNLKKDAAGNRAFSEENLATINIIECIKKAGMPIKDIKQFIVWCNQGDASLKQRLAMFQQLRQDVLGQLAQLEETLATIEYKCDYYQQAVAAGTEASVKAKAHNTENVHD